MNGEQLYIDGRLVDIDDNTKITLNYKSNLFRDVTKITSNNSYTVKLPKTVRNCQILRYFDLDARFPYHEHKVKYVKYGIEVIRDGRLFVLNVTDEAFEVSVVWGVTGAFLELSKADATLNDLKSDARILYLEQPERTKWSDYENGKKNGLYNYFYAGYNSVRNETVTEREGWQAERGSGDSLDKVKDGGWLNGLGNIITGGTAFDSLIGTLAGGTNRCNPVVRVSWLLDLIRQQYGVSFVWDSVNQEMIDSLAIVPAERKANELTLGGNFEAEFASGQGNGVLRFTQTAGDSSMFTVESGNRLRVNADSNIALSVIGLDTRVYTNGTNGLLGKTYWNSVSYITIHVYDSEGNQKATYQAGGWDSKSDFLYYINEGGITYENMAGVGRIDLKKGDSLTFVLTADVGYYNFRFIGGTIKAYFSSEGDVEFGQYYPIIYNLPGIKVMDFVKFLSIITGTFPRQREGDVVYFDMIDTLWNNVDKAHNWTSRLIPSGNTNEPKNLEYNFNDYAQHNILKWKDDETVVGNYDGDMEVKNESLNYEKVMAEFPFAASDKTIPLWVYRPAYHYYDKENGEYVSGESRYEWNKVEPRIVRLVSSGQTDGSAIVVCEFDLNAQNIIDMNYRRLQKSLENIRVIKEKFVFSVLDIMNIDETIPVYLAQYGKYYAICEIKLSNDDVAEVTMLELTI